MTPKIEEIRNLYTLVKNSANSFPERIALSEYKKEKLNSLLYSELLSAIDKKAEELYKIQIKAGSNVALAGSNSIDWVVTFFSIIKIGCVVVPIDPKMNKKGIEFILEFTNSKLFLVDNVKNFNISTKLKSLIHSMNSVEIKVQGKGSKNMQPLVLLKNIRSLKREINNDIAEILFTSGTTGTPKGVVLTQNNLLSNIKDIHSMLPLENHQKSFSILPLHHVYELTCGLLHNISRGNHTHLCSKIDITNMAKEMNQFQPTVWPVVPLILEKIYKNINKTISRSNIKMIIFKLFPKLFGLILRRKLGLKKLKVILSGGAPLNSDVETFFTNIGLPITQGYGLSEASPLISVNPMNNQKIGSVGRIISSCKVVIKNPNDKGHGLIMAKGPNIFPGYYKNKELTDEILKDGWLNTGDIGFIDEEGYLYITGREKFVIVNKGGLNIYPEEIEEFFSSSIYIKDIVVFSDDNENIIALIRPDEEFVKDKDESEIGKVIYSNCIQINKGLESYKRVKKFYLSSHDFEKTSTQKIKRSFLKNINLEDYSLAR